MKLSDPAFLRRLRAIVADPFRVTILDHAGKRMKKRKITPEQVLECLQKGKLVEPAHLTIYGEWKATVMCRCAGDVVQVAVVLEKTETGDYAVVVTVMH